MSGLKTREKIKIRLCQKFLSFTQWKPRGLPRAGSEHGDVPLKQTACFPIGHKTIQLNTGTARRNTLGTTFPKPPFFSYHVVDVVFHAGY